MPSTLTHFECSKTGERYPKDELLNLSKTGAPLLARYDLKKAAETLKPENLANRRNDMWRYHEVLPFTDDSSLVTLNEGFTPLRPVDRLRKETGFSRLFMKDESVNPTGSFKARGLAAAVNGAIQRGVKSFAIPTAGNAGGALSAYAALAGKPCHIFMPADSPKAFITECRSNGAHVELVDGLITDCGKIVASRKDAEGWHDISTLKEPFRLEGKKTMGYELFEQLGRNLPDTIIYPTGGGTGLIGMWKAFAEMKELGWIQESAKLPKMISVQAAGCAPIVRAFENGDESADFWEDAHTAASGLRVPAAVADFLILRAIRESGGTAVAVDDETMIRETHRLNKFTGVFSAPEGGACLAVLDRLEKEKIISKNDAIVLFNTGSGYKYLEALTL